MTGLHDTGKTSYIAALRYFVGENDKYSSFTLDNLSTGDDKYITYLSNCWLECSRIARSNYSNPSGESVVLNLNRVDSGKSIVLDIPDLLGETFNMQFKKRVWSQDFYHKMKEVTGMLMFVNPEDPFNMPKLIYHENEHLRAFGEEPINNPEGEKTFNMDEIPNQVKLVDFLQFVQLYCQPALPLKLGVIISRWDRVESALGTKVKPCNWLEKSLPLLFQFLTSNSQDFSCRYFGVSAQGGDYEVDGVKNELLAINPIDRILVKDEDEKTNDIGRPLLWVTS